MHADLTPNIRYGNVNGVLVAVGKMFMFHMDSTVGGNEGVPF